MRTVGAIRAGAALVVLVSTSVAMAGILADGDYGMAGWWGVRRFESGIPFPGRLAVDVEFCVYAPAEEGQPSNFDLAFDADVDPSDGTDYVYAYQLLNDLVDHPWDDLEQRSPVSRFTIYLSGEDEEPVHIGSIDGDGVNVTSSAFEPTPGPPNTAGWDFSPKVEYMQVSDVLFFTAPGGPEPDQGSMLGDVGAKRLDMPSPSTAPEPVTLTLFALGAAYVCHIRRARRRGVFLLQAN